MSRIPKFNTGKSLTTDEVPDMPTIRKRPNMNLRRSKSYTDIKLPSTNLGATATFSSRKPPANSTKKPLSSAVSRTVNLNNKPKLHTNIVNSNNIKSSVLPKIGTKRAAEGSETEGKNKVVRRRVPEWDYKTRFEILNEKYTTLFNDHKNSKDKLSEFNEIKLKNEELEKDKATILLQMNQFQKTLQEVEKQKTENESKIAALSHSNEELKKNNEELNKSNYELENKYQRVMFDADCTRKELDILKDKYEECCQKLDEISIERENLKSEVFNAEKLRRKLHNNIQDIKDENSRMAEAASVNSIVAAMTGSAENMESTSVYKGFNPFTMRKTLMELGGNNLKTDLPTLLMVYLMRGTNIYKAAEKTNEEGAAILRSLAQRYKVAKPGVKLARQTVTMARIAASYPDVLCRVLYEKPSLYNGPLNPTEFGDMNPFIGLQCFPALVPQSNKVISEILLKHHFSFMIRFDNIINEKTQKFTPSEKIKDYQIISWKSPLIKEKDRILLMISLGVCKEDGDGNLSITEAYDDINH